MPDIPDYELQTPEPPRPPLPQRPRYAPWIAAAIVAAIAGAAVWFYLRAPEADPIASEPVAEVLPAAPQPPAAAPRSLCAPTGAAAAPPVDGSDKALAPFVRALSSHPRVTAWAATGGLVRSFTVAVENIAGGRVPVQPLRALAPSGPFRVIDTDKALLVDPRSYARYTPIAAAVASVDAQGAARLCAALRPRLEEAYRELGRVEPFDQTLERAITSLLSTPVPAGDVRLVPAGAVYEYEDEALQRLTPAQRQLLRMGPRNMQIVQDKLRQVALAIGIPSERLPQ